MDKTKTSTNFDFKEIDIFGEQIIFTVRGKSTLKSYYGVFFTLLLGCISVFMFFFMGKSFFLKLDPLTTYAKRSFNNPLIFNTSLSKRAFLGIRINGDLLDGKKYMVWSQIDNFATNNVTGNGVKISSSVIYPVPCSETAGLDKDYMDSIDNIGSFHCIALNHPLFGGSTADPYYTTYQVTVRMCDKTASPICTVTNVAIQMSVLAAKVDLLYPEVFFDPTDYDEPLKIKHILTSDEYKPKSPVTRNLYFRETTLQDDRGWILQDNKEISLISIGQTTSQAWYKTSDTDPLMIRYNLGGGTFKEDYTRKYQKIQDVIAVVGGFIRVCQVAFKILLFYFFKYLKSQSLINGVIDWREEPESFEIPTSSYVKIHHSSKIRRRLNELIQQFKTKHTVDILTREPSNLIEINDNINILSRINKNNISSLDQSNIKLFNKTEDAYTKSPERTVINMQDNKKRNEKIEMKDLSLAGGGTYSKGAKGGMLNDKDRSDDNENNKDSKNLLDHHRYKFELKFMELIKSFFCKRWLKPEQFIRVKMFEMADKYARERLDIFGYFDLVNEVNKIKKVVFNPYQRSSLNYIDHPTMYINNPKLTVNNVANLKYLISEKRSGNEDIYTIAEYYASKIFKNKVSRSDSILIESFNEELIAEIVGKLTRILADVKENKKVKFDESIHEIEEDAQ